MESETGGVVDEIVGYLRDAVSVHLVGLSGSGRSLAARQAADRLREHDVPVVTIRGVTALRDRALAMLAVAGVEIPPATATSAISTAVDALSTLMSPPHCVLVVDDADDLDSASAGVVAAAYARRPFPVLAVTRPGSRRQSASRALVVALHPAVRIGLDPLDFGQVHRIVRRLLPGLVDPSTIAQIATLSGGLPSLVGAIVDAGRRTGAIAEEHTVWRTTGDLWNSRLAPAVEPLLADLADDEVNALVGLALAGTVAVAEAKEAIPDHLFLRLHESGLLQVVETQVGPLVGVFPPLAAEYLRHSAAATSRLTLPGGQDTGPRGGTDPLAPRIPLTNPRAALLNLRILEHWRVESEALLAAWRADPNVENAVTLLTALNGAAAAPAEFAAVFDGTRVEGADPLWLVWFIEWQADYQALVLGDVEGARALLACQRAALPRFATQLRAIEATLHLALGTVPGDDLLAPARPGDDPLGAETLDVLRRLTLAIAGQTVDALAESPGRIPLDASCAETSRVAIGLARVLHGDFADGVAWALRAMAEAEDRLDPGGIQAHAYVAALGLSYAGRLDELHALLGPVLTLSGTTMLHEYYQVGLLGLAALAASWRGEKDYSEPLALQADAIECRSGPFTQVLHAGIHVLADSRSQDGEACEWLWKAVEERFAGGHIAAGIELAVAAAEIAPDAARAAEAVSKARATQSPFLATLGDYIAAIVTKDPVALAGCVADLRGSGARLYAVRAAVTRALALRTHGDLDAAVSQADDAWSQARELGQQCAGPFLRLGRAVGLTAREREIALFLADGLASQEIAASLNLSIRTVENYLSSIYHKVGTKDRTSLVQAVTTWAAPR